MANNNSKIISHASPHTIKKFELIEYYINAWAHKLLLTKSCNGIIFIDCMCNSGVYEDDNKNTVYGTPIRISKALLEVARRYPDKQVHLYFNDYDPKKIEELQKYIPDDERNYKVITSTEDGNELLKFLGQQLTHNSSMHYFLLYDPYVASINWEALRPFFLHWGEVLINHMILDSIRAIPQVKKQETKIKYESTYLVADIEELVPYGSDKSAYEGRLIEIIKYIRGSATNYYVATFPFFNRNNSLVYDLVHFTNHKKGFILFKESAWKIFGDKSSSKNKRDNGGQLILDFETGEAIQAIEVDEYCYDTLNMASYVQEHFRGQASVSKDMIWELLDRHPVFPSTGYKKKLIQILKSNYNAKVSINSVTFENRRG